MEILCQFTRHFSGTYLGMKWYLPITPPSKSQTHQKASSTLIA